MLDLSKPPPEGHPLADFWDCLRWLKANRGARRPPKDFPPMLWGSTPYVGAQPGPFLSDPPAGTLLRLWSAVEPSQQLDIAIGLLRLGVRGAQLHRDLAMNQHVVHGLVDTLECGQKPGPLPTVRQIFRLHPSAAQANSLIDSLLKRLFFGRADNILYSIRGFELAFAEYDAVVDVENEKLSAAEAWSVFIALILGELEVRVCHRVTQLYFTRKALNTRCASFMDDPDKGLTAADRIRFYLQYGLLSRSRY